MQPLNLERIFFPQRLNEEQLLRLREIADQFYSLAKFVEDKCPASAERTIVVRKLQEAKLLAVNSIAVNEEVVGEFDPRQKEFE